ncbi:DNA topoisomerase IV, alpha subunit [Aureobasidium pullulans]|uniref:DNA topoisomerase (ATP-hydrolyzing) n=1 Tax=Aureobasidium pullulans TaxID=5580 RepID=A0AB74JI61_AURPU|nr:DNA topoisomerase IV, alpha subunit [Aureobasidium pullulans]THX61133.1 DNA topoisomerase IV, alpha subunit [Aureobasidium pullulans]
MDDEFDHDMLFEFESPVASSGRRDAFLVDAPQLSRQTKHNDVIAQIEAVFETVADALLNERADITVSLAAHSTSSQDDPSTRGPKATFTFPGKNASDAWRFSLFGKQATVDRYVDQIAAAFAVPRSSLNVTAGVKGLMAGAAVIHRRDGSKIGLTNVQNGVLVSSMEEVLSVDLSRVRWILVVEKEATFQSIISSEFWQEMMWHAVIVTGKGYPDIATRAIARFMSIASPQNGFAEPPVFGLVDYDPDGMAILHTYKHGSKKMSEDNAALIVPTIQWMGLRSRDITDEDHTHRNQGLMPLTRRDRHKARKMLEWEQFSDLEEAAQWRRELQVMLMLNLKAEIQIIDSDPSGLAKMIKYAVKDT